MFEKIKEIILEQLDIEEIEIKLESKLIDDLGADSLDLVEILAAVEDEYNVEFTSEELKKVTSIEEIIKLIERKKHEN